MRGRGSVAVSQKSQPSLQNLPGMEGLLKKVMGLLSQVLSGAALSQGQAVYWVR